MIAGQQRGRPITRATSSNDTSGDTIVRGSGAATLPPSSCSSGCVFVCHQDRRRWLLPRFCFGQQPPQLHPRRLRRRSVLLPPIPGSVLSAAVRGILPMQNFEPHPFLATISTVSLCYATLRPDPKTTFDYVHRSKNRLNV